MLKHDRKEMSEVTDVHRTNEPHRCIICNYFYFLKVNLRFQPKTLDVFDLMKKATSFDSVAIVFVNGNYYRI